MKSRELIYDVEKGTDEYSEYEAVSNIKRQRLSLQACRSSTLDWMAFMDDECPLSSLTIPGTHDSAAYTTSLPFISTQAMDFLDQLNAGIRFFDLRCGIRDDVVEMVHGPRYLGLTLKWVLESMYIWLATHPTEALVVQIKEDKLAQRSVRLLSEGVFDLIAQTPDRWRTEVTTPLLGELRGRIQLFRRFFDDNLEFFGVDVTEWEDNPPDPFTIIKHGVPITIQDHYNFSDPQPLPSVIARKGGDVYGLMQRAAQDADPNHWYLNFTSAFEFNLWYQITPRQIAVGGWHVFQWEEGMNVRLRSSLDQMDGKKRRFGIVVMDFPELGVEDLIPALIQTNFDLEERRRMRPMSTIAAVLMVALMLLGIDIWTGERVHVLSRLEPQYAWLRDVCYTMYSATVHSGK